MYTLVTLAAGIGAILIPGKSIKVIGLTAIVSTIIYLPPSRSIVGAVAISSVMTLGIGAILVRRYSWWGLIIASIVTTLVVGGSLTSPQAAPFLVELSERISGLDPFSGRDRIINSALVVWKEHPFIGTGWFSFGAATSAESVQAVLERRGLDYNSDIYWHFPHGHNLWVTMLIERGLFGVAAVTMLLVMYLWHLVPTALGRRGDDEVGRGVALSAVLVVVGFIVAGLGNTTMMNEHGHAGMTVIAVAYGYIRATRQAAV
jgi:O-antigen ligase